MEYEQALSILLGHWVVFLSITKVEVGHDDRAVIGITAALEAVRAARIERIDRNCMIAIVYYGWQTEIRSKIAESSSCPSIDGHSGNIYIG